MADRIKLRRVASILVAISVVLSSFTGFLIFAVGDMGQASSFEETGDMYIGEDYADSYKHVHALPLSGDLYVRSGGLLIVEGGSLEFTQRYIEPGHPANRISTIVIEDGGKLVLRNATLTARIIDVENALPSLGIMVRNGGVFEAYDSTIIASGHLVVDDSTFNLTRSKVIGPNTDDVEGHCDQGHFPMTDFDDSLVMLFMSSRVNLINSSIENVFESDNEDGSNMFNHNYDFVNDANAANGTRVGASYLFYRMPSTIANDGPTGSLDDLLKDDKKSYIIDAQERLWLDGFNVAGMMFSSDDDVELKLNIEYITRSAYNPADLTVNYMFRNGVWADTGMELEATPVDPVDGVPQQRTATWTLPSMSAQDLHGLNIEMDNVGAGTIEVDRIWVSIAIALDTYRNITLAGNTDLTAVDTYIGVDQSNDAQKKNRMVLMDDSQAYLYGIYIDGEDAPNIPSEREYPFVMVSTTFQATPGVSNDDTNENVGNITDFGESIYRYYAVETGEQISLSGFNTTDIRGTVLAVKLRTLYEIPGSSPSSQSNQIQWAVGDTDLRNSGIVPTRIGTEPRPYSNSSDLFTLGLRDMASINKLNIQFVNGDSSNTIQFDKIWLDITISPTIYIYRWSNITVTDSIGQLVSGAEVHADLQSTGREAYYYTAEGLQDHPADEVLRYLGKTADDFNVTGLDGKVKIPYLSEIRNLRASNPYLNMTYLADVTFKSELWGDDSKSLSIEFQTYMALSEESASRRFIVVLDNLLIRLPDLSIASGDISFSPRYVTYGSDVVVHIYLRNLGKIGATNVLVEAYDGNKLLGMTYVDVAASGSATTSITWNTGDRAGEYPITIIVNRERTLQESNYLNNEASKNIIVSVPMSDEDFVIGGSKYPTMNVTGPLDIGSNIKIIGDGRLTMNGGILRILQTGNSNFALTISDDGVLELINGAAFTTNSVAVMFLNGSATLLVRDSGIRLPVTVAAEGSSTLTLINAAIESTLVCSPSSRATVDATNSTFSRAWTEFGGDAVAHLTDVAIPSITPMQNARVYIYGWLGVTVRDGSSVHPIVGASVSMEYSKAVPDGISGPKTDLTDENGKVLFEVLRSKLTQNKVENMGSVLIRANYNFNGVIYHDDAYRDDPYGITSVPIGAYSTPLERGTIAASLTISDLRPDFQVTIIGLSPTSRVADGEHVQVTASIANVGGVAASTVSVQFDLGVTTPRSSYSVTIPFIAAGGIVQVSGQLLAKISAGVIEEAQTVTVTVNPNKAIKENDYDNNQATRAITVVKGLPNIVLPESLLVSKDGTYVDDASVGETVEISTIARNSGTLSAYDVLFIFYVENLAGDRTEIGRQIRHLGSGQDVLLNLTWTVNVTMGDYALRVIADPDNVVEETNDDDGEVFIMFTVDAPNTKIVLNPLSGVTYEPGKSVFVSGKVTNRNTTKPVSGATVEVWLEVNGNKIGESVTGTTASDGTFGISLHLRQGLDGQYFVYANASIGGKSEVASEAIQVKTAPEGGIPWYVYLLIFALVSAVIIVFSAYLYKYGLGRMVECGECAALIPEASKRCPKCGVQFEPGTAKCSECSAWIPSNSTQCPECGTKFITEAIKEEEDAHIKRMREQYESYVETYREEAKIEMGRKYTDARFPIWWKKHPAFISFEQWLSQEEEKLKSGGTPCPVCGIHNPRGSPICQKCGSTLEVLKAPTEPAKDAPPRKPLRRIVRRPVPGTGKDKPASAEPKPEEAAKAPEESSDNVSSDSVETPSEEVPKP